MQRPVFDRGPREAVSLPQLRRLEALEPDTDQLQANRFERLIDEQRAREEAGAAETQAQLDALRDSLREQLSSAEDAARSERSDVTKALEGRIDELRRGIDAETLDLRQAGLDERAALARQIEEGDKIVREAQELSVSNLQDRLFTLSDDLASINSAIDENYDQLTESQKASADSTQTEIDGLNQQLESLYADVESGNAAQSETIRNETANLISGLEQQIGGLADNLGALPIESIQAQLAAVNDQTSQFQSAVDAATAERGDLAAQIAALRDADLTQADLATLSENIAGQRQADITAALDPIAAQRQADIAAAIDPIAALRQEAISGAIDPIQQQIESLRAEIPQQIDTDALRQQLRDEILASLPEATPSVGSGEGNLMDYQGPSFAETPDSFGFNAPASLNMSDGRADALGLFDEGAGTEVETAVPPTIEVQMPEGFGTPEYEGNRGINPAVGRRPDDSIITLSDTQANPIDFELAFGKPANEKTPRAAPPTAMPVKPLPVKPQPVKPLPIKPQPVKPMPVKPPIIMPPREEPPIFLAPGNSGPIIANPGQPPLVPPPVKAVKPAPRIKPLPVKLPQIEPRPVKPLPIVLPQPKRKLRSPVLRRPRFGR